MRERIGGLRSRISIMTPSVSQDTHGEQQETYSVSTTVWGKVEYQGGSESFQAGKVVVVDTVKITVRYLSTLAVTHKVRINGDTALTFNIDSIMPDDNSTWMVITAKRQE